MPVNVYHGLLSLFVIVMIIAALTATTYVTVTNMLADAYRYEKSIEKANEKVRLAAATTSDGVVYYGVRNVGMSELIVTRSGVALSDGRILDLVGGLRLGPGDVFIDKKAVYGGLPVVFFVITSRGNVFAVSVVNMSAMTGSRDVVRIRSLLPSVFSIPLSVSNTSTAYVATITMYGYIFGFLVVDDPYSDESHLLQIGPVSVASLYENNSIPYAPDVTWSSQRLDAYLELVFNVSKSYNINMITHIERTDGGRGILIYGCFGYIWRTMASTTLGFRLASTINEYYSKSGGDYYVEERFISALIPSSLDVNSIVASLARGAVYSSIEATSGSQAYILLAKCFKVESLSITEFWTFSETSSPVDGVRIVPYINFPGGTRMADGLERQVYELVLEVKFDPQIYVLSAVGAT